MKTYKDLNTLTEIAQAMDAGKNVQESQMLPVSAWLRLRNHKLIDMNKNKYRTVEETELPEQGDEILVWSIAESEAQPMNFVCFYKDFVITEYANTEIVSRWRNWKPIDKKPREWFIGNGTITELDTSPGATTIVPEFKDMVHVREVLEDE